MTSYIDVRAILLTLALIAVPEVALASQGGGRGDSLWNGILIGAGAGAVVGALVGHAISDCSECSGFYVPLTFGVLGAGVGAGVGAAVDAARHQRSMSAVARRPRRHLHIAPLLLKHRKGLSLRITF